MEKDSKLESCFNRNKDKHKSVIFKEVESKSSIKALEDVKKRTTNNLSDKHLKDRTSNLAVHKSSKKFFSNLINKYSTSNLSNLNVIKETEKDNENEQEYACFKDTSHNFKPPMKKEKSSMIQDVEKQAEEAFNSSYDNYYIDSSNNLPEYYEQYVVENLRIIKNMQFFFHQDYYDKTFDEIQKDINEKVELDYTKAYIIFDLDETLIHSEIENPTNSNLYDKKFTMKIFPNLENPNEFITETFGVFIRPKIYDFLTWLKQYFRLAIWTAAEEDYALDVLKTCDLESYFDFVLSRKHTINVKNFYIKDLSLLNTKFEKLNCLIVDNNIYSFACCISQGILISSFYQDKSDEEVDELQKYFTDNIISNIDCMVHTNNDYYLYQVLMTNLTDDNETLDEDLEKMQEK